MHRFYDQDAGPLPIPGRASATQRGTAPGRRGPLPGRRC